MGTSSSHKPSSACFLTKAFIVFIAVCFFK
jgi:hypothetical protein